MFKILLIGAVIACAWAAPAPYDNPAKSGTVQEISKYHVTAQNKNSPAVVADHSGLDRPSPVNPAVISDPAPKTSPTVTRLSESEEEKLRKTRENPAQKPAIEAKSDSKIKPIEGPTTVAAPTTVKVQVSAHHNTRRSADHTPAHTEETKKNDEKRPDNSQSNNKKPEEFKRTSNLDDLKKTHTSPIIAKRESDPVKAQDTPQVNVKPIGQQKPDQKNPTPVCNSRECTHHHHSKRDTASSATTQVNVKPVTAAPGHVLKDSSEQKNDKVNSKPIAKREDSTTDSVPTSTTQAAHHLSPTSVHSSFSHTWTRPQVKPAVEALKDEDKIPAASDNKPTLAIIDPLRPVLDAKTSTTTTAPSSTTSAGHRVRRGVDQTEAQDEPTSPKPTKAWWRSLDLSQKDAKPEATPAVIARKEDEKKPIVAAAVPKEKLTQKRETADKTVQLATSAPATTKQTRPAEQLPTVEDNKPPQFVRPVPVAQILGSKQAEIATFKRASDSSEEQEKDQKKDDKSAENKPTAVPKPQTKEVIH